MILGYIVGIVLALITCGILNLAGFDRDRSLYPVMTIVIASYYLLFAVQAGDDGAFIAEFATFAVFVAASIAGFKVNLWVVVVALLGHGTFDVFHAEFNQNEGVPGWWPSFCLGFDIVAGMFLAWLLLSKRVTAENRFGFANRIRGHVEFELAAAKAAERAGDLVGSFQHLERAHVLGQQSTRLHVAVHVRMLMWGLRRRNAKEVRGQLLRMTGAVLKTWIGMVPRGNTGGANIPAYRSVAIPQDLADLIAEAQMRPQSSEL